MFIFGFRFSDLQIGHSAKSYVPEFQNFKPYKNFKTENPSFHSLLNSKFEKLDLKSTKIP